jgi:hypothetical protein
MIYEVIMIGIINNELDAYSIIDKITKRFDRVDIYLYKEDVTDINMVINKLIDKGCRVIIMKDKISNIEKMYPNINFIYLEDIDTYNGYVLDNDNLINAIISGNLVEVRSILSSLNIEKEKVIILNNPKLLFIKSIISEIYKDNKIIDNIGILIDKLVLLIDNVGNGEVYIIN